MPKYLSLFPIPLAILAFVWYGNSVTAQTEIPKSPPCTAGNTVQIVQPEPDVLFVNYPEAKQAMGFLKQYRKSQRMKVPCEASRRIRSPKDERCYLKSRLP